MCPVNDLEQPLPVSPVLYPELLLYTIPKFAITGCTPQAINGPKVHVWDKLHLESRSAIIQSAMIVTKWVILQRITKAHLVKDHLKPMLHPIQIQKYWQQGLIDMYLHKHRH